VILWADAPWIVSSEYTHVRIPNGNREAVKTEEIFVSATNPLCGEENFQLFRCHAFDGTSAKIKHFI
jgi:hypothetical protein